MAKSYVGVITSRGLESLLPETQHAVQFLLRRAYRHWPPAALCYWAVMPEAAADEVARQLYGERRQEALVTLNARASYLGIIPPAGADEAGLKKTA